MKTDNIRLWSPDEALENYRHAGGHITDPTNFGIDPIRESAKIRIRERAFVDVYPSFEPIFFTLVNGKTRLFREGLLFYCDVTFRVSCT